MPERHPVIIVGSGVAGMAAADLLAGYGVRVLVVDDNARAGGQLLRKFPLASHGIKRFEPDRLKRRGLEMVRRIDRDKVQILNSTQVLGLFPENTLLLEKPGAKVSTYRAETVILATGARERHLPFKGWTLPGVMATGAAQILMKSSGVLPGRNTLIAGCGPLMLVLAAEILTNGGQVRALLDQSAPADKLRAFKAGASIWPKLLEGGLYLARLAAHRVPVRPGVRVIAARGRRHLETVVAARVDAKGRAISGTEKTYSTQTLAVGHGFSPNIELPRQAGCALAHDDDKGGWHVDVNATMATSVPGIYAVGEATGIAGGGKSFIEGRLAAWNILYSQSRVDRERYVAETGRLLRLRRQQVQYGRFLNRWCQPPTQAYADISDDTIICRCEEVTMGDIRKQIANDFITINSLKKATRCGMGNCQGRTCGPILFDVISHYSQQPSEAVGYSSARAPVKTVCLGGLAGLSANDAPRGQGRVTPPQTRDQIAG